MWVLRRPGASDKDDAKHQVWFSACAICDIPHGTIVWGWAVPCWYYELRYATPVPKSLGGLLGHLPLLGRTSAWT